MTEIKDLTFITSCDIYNNPQYPITKSKLFTQIKNGTFPKPMKVTNAFHWVKADIDAFYGITE